MVVLILLYMFRRNINPMGALGLHSPVNLYHEPPSGPHVAASTCDGFRQIERFKIENLVEHADTCPRLTCFAKYIVHSNRALRPVLCATHT